MNKHIGILRKIVPVDCQQISITAHCVSSFPTGVSPGHCIPRFLHRILNYGNGLIFQGSNCNHLTNSYFGRCSSSISNDSALVHLPYISGPLFCHGLGYTWKSLASLFRMIAPKLPYSCSLLYRQCHHVFIDIFSLLQKR